MNSSFFEDSYFVKVFRNSFFYHIFSCFAAWCSKQWQNSLIIEWATSQRCEPDRAHPSIISRLARTIYIFLRKIAFFLHFDRITEGSVFRKTWFWSGLTLFAAPILPTKLVILLALVAFCSLILELLCGKERSLCYFPVNKLIYAFCFVFVFSVFASLTVSSSIYVGGLTVFFALFFIVLSNSITSYRQLKTIAAFAVAAGVLVSLYGFYQSVAPDQSSGAWLDSDMFSGISFRVYSTLDNPNVLGEYLLLVIPLGVAFLFSSENWGKRILWLICVGIMLICMILTYSRGCWVGILVAAAIFLVMLDRRFIILGIAVLCIAPFILPDSIMERITSIGDMSDSSTSYRVYIWLGTIAMLKTFWFSGLGPGQAAFNKVYPLYSYNTIEAPHAHNLFLQITCDTGICGLVLIVAIFISYFRALCTAIRKETQRENKMFQMAGVASMAGFMVQSMFDYTFYNYRVILLFFGYMALYLLFAKFHCDSAEVPSNTENNES